MRTLKALGRTALVWLALAALQACGPGVGGSGTGQGLDTFGASAPAGGGGSSTVYFADTTGSGRVAVTVQGDSIELDAPCAGLRFRGQWGLLAGQAARFYGLNGEGSSAQPAQVRASLAEGGLQLTVLDANGNVLLGPVLVTVRATAATPGGC